LLRDEMLEKQPIPTSVLGV